MENLIERLELQSAAFQESFDMLSSSRTLEKLAQNFFLILRGNLLVVDAAMFINCSEKSGWQKLFSKLKIPEKELTDILNSGTDSQIIQVNHAVVQLLIKHHLIDKKVIGIVLGSKLDKSDYSEFDKIILQFFLQQLDSAYQFFKSRKKEKQLIFDLNHRVLQLNSLIDTGIEVARLQEIRKLMHLSLERVLALTNASKGMLRVKNGREVVEKIFYPFPFKSKKIENSNYQIFTSFSFANRKYQFYLFEKESRDGLVRFDATDQLLLDAFARQVYASLENHYFYEQSLEKERIDQEISLAGDIQKKLIPAELPKINGFDLYGINIPTKFIGGDYYDCIPLKDGRYLLIIADVSGKGVAAGLLVSTLHASLHAFIDSPFELAELVQKLNEIIYNSSTIDKYITAFFVLLDPKTGKLQSVHAGHNPSYIIRKNKKIEELKIGGIPLGMMDMPFPYETKTAEINPGDRLILYTDGVTEAMNEHEEEYDDIRSLKKFLISNLSPNAKDFIDDLMTDLHNFTGDTPQSDDITALYLVRKE